MSSIAIESCVLHLRALSPGTLTLTDSRGELHTMSVAAVRELVGLLDRTLAEDAPRGRIGSVRKTDGQELHVLRYPCHVTIHDHPDPQSHCGWTLRLQDQVRALRDTLARATQ